MPYSLIRQLLFQIEPETSHRIALKSINLAKKTGLIKAIACAIPNQETQLMGLTFPNPVGLAAGLDKNGDYIDALAALGFGFIEVGTVTPRPQAGNTKPRLFRLTEQQAIINRMGFNNKGIDYLIRCLKNSSYTGILGINIGKNKDTPIEAAIDDYLECLNKAYPYASYITINISSPNTPGLRNLQLADNMSDLLSALSQQRNILNQKFKKYVPLAIKIAPDLNDDEIHDAAGLFLKHQIDAVIAGNTTTSREFVEDSPYANEKGGLSGKPLLPRANRVLERFHLELQNKIPIIGVGGINSGVDAVSKLKAGASLIQIYSGFIYKGPKLIKEIADSITEYQNKLT